MNKTLKIILTLHTTPDTEKQQELIQKLIQLEDKNQRFSENVALHFLILGSLAHHKPGFITGEVLARTVELLTSLEQAEGGPYYSSIDTKEVELDTNIAIAYFLASQDIEIPSLTQLIEEATSNNDFKTKHLGSNLVLMYVTSLFYQGDRRQELLSHIYNTSPQNELEEELKSIIEHFPIKTTSSETTFQFTPEEEVFMKKIFDHAEERFRDLPKDMRDLVLEVMKKTIRGNPDKQMSLMTLYLRQALGEQGREIPDELLVETSLANIFYWTAFIIYDDFWDEDDKAYPRALPVANLFARHYSTYFTTLFPPEKGFTEFFQTLMDKLDSANNWETTSCRARVEGNTFYIPETLPEYGSYEQKYEPASGHILGSVALFLKLGFTIESAEVTNLIGYFRHYLIAMQLNDDAHDWEEDLERGTLSTVVVMILEEIKKKFPDKTILDLEKDKELITDIYWFTVIQRACTEAIHHTTKSREALAQISLITNSTPLAKYIDKPDRIAQQALDEYTRSVEFLKNYSQRYTTSRGIPSGSRKKNA